MPYRTDRVIGVMGDQLGPPVQRTIVPWSPTAQALARASPHTPYMRLDVPLVVALNADPFQCRIAPASPTAHTSSVAVPPTPHSRPAS